MNIVYHSSSEIIINNIFPSEEGYDITKYGDAIYETSNAISGSKSWFGDYSNLPGVDYPWFARGGRRNSSSGAGIFAVNGAAGGTNSSSGFRVVIIVMS